MKFFSRKSRHGSTVHRQDGNSYNDYYDAPNVVPNTIEYHLEFGQEMEVEDIFLQESGTLDDETTAYSTYKPGGIPLLTIVDATTHEPITKTVIPKEEPIMQSNVEEETSQVEEDSTIDLPEAQLEVKLSEYENEFKPTASGEVSPDDRTSCTIRTVGFKSAAASAHAAQEIAAKYMSYRQSCETQDVIQTAFSTNDAKIVLHADEKGETIATMSRATDTDVPSASSSPSPIIYEIAVRGNERDITTPVESRETPNSNITPPASNVDVIPATPTVVVGESAAASHKSRKTVWFRRIQKSMPPSSNSTRHTRFSDLYDDGSTIATRTTLRKLIGSKSEVTHDVLTHTKVTTIATPTTFPAPRPSPAPLAILYDDKRNHVAFLRCAPRRSDFDFPIGPRVEQMDESRDPPPTSMRSSDGSMSKSNDSHPELEQTGSTISMYKRKLEELQRKHAEVLKLLQ
jgi:hypothetical protein